MVAFFPIKIGPGKPTNSKRHRSDQGALGNLPADFKYEPGLVVAEGDFVTIHGRYFGWGPKPMVAVDIFSVANGKIAEHWDVMQEEVPAAQTASGNSMLTVTEPDL